MWKFWYSCDTRVRTRVRAVFLILVPVYSCTSTACSKPTKFSTFKKYLRYFKVLLPGKIQTMIQTASHSTHSKRRSAPAPHLAASEEDHAEVGGASWCAFTIVPLIFVQHACGLLHARSAHQLHVVPSCIPRSVDARGFLPAACLSCLWVAAARHGCWEGPASDCIVSEDRKWPTVTSGPLS